MGCSGRSEKKREGGEGRRERKRKGVSGNGWADLTGVKRREGGGRGKEREGEREREKGVSGNGWADLTGVKRREGGGRGKEREGEREREKGVSGNGWADLTGVNARGITHPAFVCLCRASKTKQGGSSRKRYWPGRVEGNNAAGWTRKGEVRRLAPNES